MSQNETLCVFINTELGIPIYDLETSQYWIKNDYSGENLIQLKDIEPDYNNQIFIPGLAIDRLYIEVSERWSDFITKLLYVMYSKDSKCITLLPEYFSGTNIYDFTINKSFISKFNIRELECILTNIMLGSKDYYRINKQYLYPQVRPEDKVQKIYSFNFVKQLKSIALLIDYDLSFNCSIDDMYISKEVYWTYDKFIKSGVYIPENKNEQSFYSKEIAYVNMYQGQYHNITKVIKCISDPNFNSVNCNDDKTNYCGNTIN